MNRHRHLRTGIGQVFNLRPIHAVKTENIVGIGCIVLATEGVNRPAELHNSQIVARRRKPRDFRPARPVQDIANLTRMNQLVEKRGGNNHQDRHPMIGRRMTSWHDNLSHGKAGL